MAKYQSSRLTDDDYKPRNDAYTGLLSISFVAMLIGCLLLFIDWYSYSGMAPGKVKLPALGAARGKGEAPPPKAEPKVEPKPEEKPANKAEAKQPDPKDMKKDDAKMEKKDEAKKDEAKKDEK